MRLAQDNDVVQTLTPDRSDQPFHKAILPGRGWCNWLVPDAHGAQSARAHRKWGLRVGCKEHGRQRPRSLVSRPQQSYLRLGSQMHTSNHSACHPCSNRVSPTSRTAVYGPVRTVVGEGRSCEAPPYPDRSDFVRWHETVMAAQSPHVCCLGRSGRHPLRISISHFDPDVWSGRALQVVSPSWR
jgi:hypothetical protein